MVLKKAGNSAGMCRCQQPWHLRKRKSNSPWCSFHSKKSI